MEKYKIRAFFSHEGKEECTLVRRPFLIMTGSAAAGIVLSQLYYWWLTVKERQFWKTNADLADELGMTEHEVQYAKKKIKALPFIQIVAKGIPRKTYYEFDQEALQKALEGYMETRDSQIVKLQDKLQTPTPNTNPNCKITRLALQNYKAITETTTETTIKLHSTRLRQRGDGSTESSIKPTPKQKKRDHPRWMKFATTLAGGIKQIKKVNNNAKLSTWAGEFEKLNRIEEVHPSRIRKVLQWYCKKIPERNKFIPHIWSGSAFRAKFIKVEDAMLREEPEKPPEPEKVKMNKDQKFSFKFFKEPFQMVGNYALVKKDLPNLFMEIMVWNEKLWKLAKPLLQEQEETVWGLSPEAAYSSLQETFRNIKEPYAEWIAHQIMGWSEWGGDMKEFYPGGKHFARFLRMRMGETFCRFVREQVETII